MAASLLAHAHYAWLVTASLLAGGVNAVASGGSFLSFPAMLAMGVAPVQANATNTVAIWPGQLTSVFALRGDLRKDLLTVAVLCAITGGVGGAEILLHTPQSLFLNILPWMILAATVLFLFAGRISAWLKRGAAHADAERPVSMLGLTAMLLPVCLYVGYFGAGGGLLIMATLGVLGVESMRELNSMKVLVACIANLSAVVTFIARHAVAWHYCIVAMLFAGLGGYVGARYARRLPAAAMRAMVIAVGFAVSGWFFWVAHTRT
jgi:hypothetical protein